MSGATRVLPRTQRASEGWADLRPADSERPGEVSPRLQRVRRASLRAVARMRAQPEPSERDCDGVRWDSGLVGAYGTLPGRGSLTSAAPRAEPTVALAPAYRPPFAWALAAGVTCFGVALATAPATSFWETHGHLAPARVLGIPNAPGHFLFVLLARVWTSVLSPVNRPDAELTLLALATISALAVAFFLMLQRGFHGVAGEKAWTRPAALTLVLVGVTALATTTALATVAPYALTAALLTGACWLALRARELALEPRSMRYRLGAAYLFALGATGAVSWLMPLALAAPLALRFAPRPLRR